MSTGKPLGTAVKMPAGRKRITTKDARPHPERASMNWKKQEAILLRYRAELMRSVLYSNLQIVKIKKLLKRGSLTPVDLKNITETSICLKRLSSASQICIRELLTSPQKELAGIREYVWIDEVAPIKPAVFDELTQDLRTYFRGPHNVGKVIIFTDKDIKKAKEQAQKGMVFGWKFHNRKKKKKR